MVYSHGFLYSRLLLSDLDHMILCDIGDYIPVKLKVVCFICWCTVLFCEVVVGKARKTE